MRGFLLLFLLSVERHQFQDEGEEHLQGQILTDATQDGGRVIVAGCHSVDLLADSEWQSEETMRRAVHGGHDVLLDSIWQLDIQSDLLDVAKFLEVAGDVMHPSLDTTNSVGEKAPDEMLGDIVGSEVNGERAKRVARTEDGCELGNGVTIAAETTLDWCDQMATVDVGDFDVAELAKKFRGDQILEMSCEDAVREVKGCRVEEGQCFCCHVLADQQDRRADLVDRRRSFLLSVSVGEEVQVTLEVLVDGSEG
jgi:hypothetical protein